MHPDINKLNQDYAASMWKHHHEFAEYMQSKMIQKWKFREESDYSEAVRQSLSAAPAESSSAAASSSMDPSSLSSEFMSTSSKKSKNKVNKDVLAQREALMKKLAALKDEYGDDLDVDED